MPETISHQLRTARKPHYCDYCNEIINPGEKYHHDVLKFDGIYTWKSHVRCTEITSEIWDMVDPDVGMTGDDFQDACRELCRVFVCPECGQLDEAGDCKLDNMFCTQKLHDLMQTHDLRRVRDKNGRPTWAWHFVPKKEEEHAD